MRFNRSTKSFYVFMEYIYMHGTTLSSRCVFSENAIGNQSNIRPAALSAQCWGRLVCRWVYLRVQDQATQLKGPITPRHISHILWILWTCEGFCFHAAVVCLQAIGWSKGVEWESFLSLSPEYNMLPQDWSQVADLTSQPLQSTNFAHKSRATCSSSTELNSALSACLRSQQQVEKIVDCRPIVCAKFTFIPLSATTYYMRSLRLSETPSFSKQPFCSRQRPSEKRKKLWLHTLPWHVHRGMTNPWFGDNCGCNWKPCRLEKGEQQQW